MFLVPSKPAVPLYVYNVSSTEVYVHWRPVPRGYIHGILRGYMVQYRQASDPDEVYRIKTVGPDTHVTKLTELLKYTTYGLRIVGFTSVGSGIASKEVFVTTDEDSKFFVLLLKDLRLLIRYPRCDSSNWLRGRRQP